MSMLWYIILLNVVSFYIVSNLNKNMRIKNLHKGHNKITTYLIPGMAPDNNNPFGWLLGDNSPLRGDIRVLSFQNFGYDPRAVAKQLDKDIELIKRQDDVSSRSVDRMLGRHFYHQKRKVVLVSMSMGAQVPLFMACEGVKHVAISPCFGSQNLKLNAYALHWITIALELLVALLGWIAYLPIIKIGNSRFSLALYVDWIYWSTVDLVTGDLQVDGLITSDFDKLIDNKWIYDHVKIRNLYCDRRIHCGHCDIEKHSKAYVYHINSILQVVIDPDLRGK